jgi:hypothetical protein
MAQEILEGGDCYYVLRGVRLAGAGKGNMKDLILVSEKKVNALTLRGYRIQGHFVVAIWGLQPTQVQPKRLIFESFDDMNRTWFNFNNMEAEALETDLLARSEGIQPRLPRIQRNPNRNRDGESNERPSRPPTDRPGMSSDRPYRSSSGFERNDDAPRERPRIERPRRINTDT